MERYDYVIVGGGLAGASAAIAIRETDAKGRILLIGAEPELPYHRPALSKGLWLGKEQESGVFVRKRKEWEALNVALSLGERVQAIDPRNGTVRTASGAEYGYGKILLATGGEARVLPAPPGAEDRVLTLRTLADYHRLREKAAQGGRVLVVGGGFIGAEMAAVLSQQPGLQVSMLVSGAGPLSHVLPPSLVQLVSDRYRSQGVRLVAEDRVLALEAKGNALTVHCASGRDLEADWLCYGIGLSLNTALAAAAGLDLLQDGVQVDALLRSSHPDIFVAGDLAVYPDPVWGGPVRLEHWDNAESTGRHAGRNMTGAATPFTHQSMFWSDIYEFGFEAVGSVFADMTVYEDLSRDGGRGVIYYLKDSRVHGVLLWNVWEQVDAARALIAARETLGQEELEGRIPLG